MQRYLKIFAIPLAVLFLATTGVAQDDDFQAQLEKLVGQNATSYVRPLVTGTGIGLNSGVYNTADVHSLLGFDVTLNANVVTIPDKAKTYTFDTSALSNLTFTFNDPNGGDVDVTLDASQVYESLEDAPTIFGETGESGISPNTTYAEQTIVSQIASETGMSETQVRNQMGNEIDSRVNQIPSVPVPPGFNIPAMPTASLQASLGLPFGTEAQVRYIPATALNEDLGDFGLLGLGARISIDQFIPVPFFPVDIAAGAFFQSVELGPVDIKSSIIHAEVSKSIPMLTAYGGFGLESSSLSASYDYTDPNGNVVPVKVDVDGDNSFRTNVGLRLKLLLLTISADYSIGEYNSVNAGVGLTFR
ncbi:MAG: hypothetical protein K9N46_03860 [Candidatus Marinimicrobia bacterium]|nr:hypothetical protein [Candidatus Neomarinimicrobiota bacterium]MCF7828898.1 hypothetical protein [Candidatus Neomarinimicrobiota bacterium]MCF7879858.1 hypothetical protein [Candidatus Neomarinimicrobiota bacterium]